MLNIIVTGSAGFIGSHLTEALLAEGHTVTGIDNFDPFYPRKIKEANMATFIHHPRFTFHEADLTREAIVTPLFTGDTDIVIHLAGKAGVRPSIDDPQGYIDHNITATRVVLGAIQKQGIKKLAFASSSSVYGNNPDTPWHEHLDVNNPISPYAFSKKSCELLNHTWHHLYGIDIVNMRFFTVFGPRQRPDLAIHKFTHMIYQGKPLPLFGDGSTSRDYTYVDDTVRGIKGVMNYLLNQTQVFETVNLGNNQPVSLKHLVEAIASATGKTPTIKALPMQPGDVNTTYANIEKARRLFGYQPQTTLEEGLKKFVAWYKHQNP